jgi:hypothetical protein
VLFGFGPGLTIETVVLHSVAIWDALSFYLHVSFLNLLDFCVSMKNSFRVQHGQSY